MEKQILIEFIEKNFSISKISLETNLSKTTINYWLKKYSLKTLSQNKKEKICPRCKTKKLLEDFYNRRNKFGGSVYCKKCTNNQIKERQTEYKKKCVDYKGGCCSIKNCGYNKCLTALEFHHLDPSKKDFSIGEKKQFCFDESIKKELDKCILVCSNHHREIHAGLIVL
jgi:hypothetical protein